MAVSSWTLDLGRLPVVSLNARTHWAVKAHDVANWRNAVAWIAQAERIPKLLDRPTVELVYFAPDRRRRDPDNLCLNLKAALDGLRDAGVLEDDTGEHVAALMPRIIQTDDPARRGRWELRIAA
jgi:crossover junction endodeoxyribonuclease RusA